MSGRSTEVCPDCVAGQRISPWESTGHVRRPPFFLVLANNSPHGFTADPEKYKGREKQNPTNEATSPPDTYKRKFPIWLASNSFFNHSLTKGQTALTDYRHGKKETKKEDIPVLTGISSLT